MNRFEAREISERIQQLAECHANRVVTDERALYLRDVGIEAERDEEGKWKPLTGDQAKALAVKLADLEDESAGQLADPDFVAELRIIRNDGAGPSADPRAVAFNTVAKVESIEVTEREKVVEWPDGTLQKIGYRDYTAWGEPYEAGGRECRDMTRSEPEGFLRTPAGIRPFGAASALVARLLEARVAGVD